MSLFEDDVQLNEHELAWFAKDWDAVQKAADLFKQKEESEFFEILGAIQEKKSCSIAQKSYSKFMVENVLSQHADCIPAVYAMNLVGSGLSDEAHFNYMMAAVPRGRRYGKWAKLTESNQDALVLHVLMSHYKVNIYDAQMYQRTLELKGNLKGTLKKLKGLVTDDLVKSITKNVKEQKQLKKLALEW